MQITKTNYKDLTFISLFSLIVGSMMGSGVFDIPANIANGAGVIAISIGWIITVVGILSLSWAFMYITRQRPDIQSGLYGYAKYAFGNYVGFNSAWGYALNAILANVSYLIYICATLGNFALFKFFGNGLTLKALIVESIMIWLVHILINRGIREALFINVLITTVKILILVIVILAMIYAFHYTQLKTNLHFEFQLGNMFEQIKSTMLVSVWNFTGIEAACIFAMRAKSMQDVARATLLGAGVVCLIDATISLLPFGILPGTTIRHLASPSTAGIMSVIYGMNKGDIIRLTVIISVAGALLTWTLLASNILYLAAEDKSMPKMFLHINLKNVPYKTVWVCSIVTQVFLIIAYWTNAIYLMMIQLATSLILLPYLIATIFAVKLIILERKLDIVSLIKGCLAVLYGIWLVYSGGLAFLLLSSLLYLSGSVLYFIARRQYKQALFDNKFEMIIFIILMVTTIISFLEWSKLMH